jgi:hypothetical protein
MLTRSVLAALSALAAAAVLAAPADAEPGDNPCEFAISFFSKYVPIAPDLEGDIDLTQQQPPADPNAPLPETLPPNDVCVNGCI